MQVRCDECPEIVTLLPGRMTLVLCGTCAARAERLYFLFAEKAGFDTSEWERFHTNSTSEV